MSWSLVEQCDMTGMSVCGYASATRYELAYLFGEPHSRPYERGRDIHCWWYFSRDDGRLVQLYMKLPDGIHHAHAKHSMIVWNVKAGGLYVALSFLQWLERKLRKTRRRVVADVAPIGAWLLPPGVRFYPRG